MGMSMVAMAGISAAMQGINQFSQLERQRHAQLAQAEAMEAQANLIGRQADATKRSAYANARQYDVRAQGLRRQFEQIQGQNRAALGAGNVDLSSGSAQRVSHGNINRFAADLGENAYAKALSLWEADQNYKTMQYQAELYNAKASYLESSAGTFLTSLMGGLLSGAGSFMGSTAGASALTSTTPTGVGTVSLGVNRAASIANTGRAGISTAAYRSVGRIK